MIVSNISRKAGALVAVLACSAIVVLSGCEKSVSSGGASSPSGNPAPATVDSSLPPNVLNPKGASDLSTAARLVAVRGIPIKLDESLSRFKATPPKRVAEAFEAASTLAQVDAWRDLKGLPNERFTNIRAMATPLGRFVIAEVAWPQVSERAIIVMCADQPCATVASLKGSELNPSGSPASNAVAIAVGMRIYAQQRSPTGSPEDRVMQRTLQLIDGMKPSSEPVEASTQETSPGGDAQGLKGWYAQDINHSHCIQTRSPADRIREIQYEGKRPKTHDLPGGAVEVEMDLDGWKSQVWTYYRTMESCQAALPRSQAIDSKYE